MSDNNEKYDLYTEKIQQTPAVKYRKLIRIGKYVALTAILAVTAGVCFGLAFSAVTGDTEELTDKRTEVSIPEDEYPVSTKSPVEDNVGELVSKDAGTDRSVEGDLTEGEAEGMTELSAEQPLEQSTEGAQPVVTEAPTEAEIPTRKEEPVTEQTQEAIFIQQYQEMGVLLSEINRSIVRVMATSYTGEDYLASIAHESNGSGLIIAQNGVEFLILTNYTLCSNVDSLNVEFVGGHKAQARILMGNKVTDTAVLAVYMDDIPERAFADIKITTIGNSYLVKQGQPLIAIGTLYGLSDSVEYGMAVNTSNVVYDVDGRFGMIYTNIGSDKSNSGFLFNLEGEAIGVITDNYVSNGNVASYGISDLKKIMENMSNQKEIGYLGVIGYDISEDEALRNGIPVGAYVTRTEAASPAFYAGIQSGDIITKINDRTIFNVYNISTALCEYGPGTEVNILVYRKGKEGYVPIEFTVTLSVK